MRSPALTTSLLFLATSVLAVKREDFKSCEQSSFCKRHRAVEKGSAKYNVLPNSVSLDGSKFTARLQDEASKRELSLSLLGLVDSSLRLTLDEVDGLHKRFRADDALDGPPEERKFKSHAPGEGSSLLMTADGNKVILYYRPFRLDVFSGAKELVLTLNSAGLLKYEHFRNKAPAAEAPPADAPEPTEEEKEEEAATEGAEASEDGDGFWEENFRSHQDSKPKGSSSVGMDISFVGFAHVYGLPEHADAFALRSTENSDPYRLYNLDVFEYELNNGMALYGAVPYIIGHSKSHTVGAFWLNAAETWVDVRPSSADKSMLRSLMDRFGSAEVPQVETHWMSESGLIDVFLVLGPRPNDVFRQYAKLTGVSELPPCRWNYNDMEDVASVHANFDAHDIPVDFIWLDIEHTDGKRYFTWDPNKFSDPKTMIANVAAKGRKMVTIIDPHIKKDDNYRVYKEAKDQDLYVKDRNGNDLDGWCWPGASAYLDFMNPAVREYWADQFALDRYEGSSLDLYVWNDMNEPSVFNGPEITMHKDCKHYGGWEHRDIHNMYGFYHAFFAGSQRYSSVWTGDNTADWGHLAISLPMMLSLSVAGIPFVGADVGGFFGNPDEELLVRWYQVGAFSPFFRAHAHIDTRRREPWLFSEDSKLRIRDAIRYRYRLLPFWYTTFYEHMKTGLPVMRPMWSEFPEDEFTFDEDRQFMIGNALLVRPVMEAGVTSVSAYLPGKDTLWFAFDTQLGRPGPGALYVDTPMDKIPVFQRGGTIVATKERVRRAASLMINDPVTLYVAPDMKDNANGTLYHDAGDGYAYKNGEFLYRRFVLEADGPMKLSLESSNLDPAGKMTTGVWIERIVIMGMKFHPKYVHLFLDDYKAEDMSFSFDEPSRVVAIRKPGLKLHKDWRIDIHSA